jgi:hypothetical protein
MEVGVVEFEAGLAFLVLGVVALCSTRTCFCALPPVPDDLSVRKDHSKTRSICMRKWQDCNGLGNYSSNENIISPLPLRLPVLELLDTSFPISIFDCNVVESL